MFNKKFFEKNFTSLKDVVARQQAALPGEGEAAGAALRDGPATTGDDLLRSALRNGGQEGGDAAADEQAADAPVPGMISRHKGKLAIGAAAMLGLAAFYHWRESRLAKEDEEEYARLQRLKAAIDPDASDPDS